MDSLREVLEAVAAGNLDPEQAREMIADHRSEAAVPQTPITDVFIKAGGARVVIVGDPAVAEAVADGAHRMERSGGTLLITTNMSEGDFSTAPPRSALLKWLTSVADRVGQTLTVRVNPALPLRVLIVGGTLDLNDVHGGASIGVEAGSATIGSGSGRLQVDVVSGSAKIDWTFNGESSVRADMGSAQVRVRHESDVRITAEATLGQAIVRTDHEMHKSVGDPGGVGGQTPEVVVGSGSGTLRAAARMGSVQVTVA